MKKAPNVKKLPKDPLSEAIIFAGDEAWTHAKNWQNDNPANDEIPPVVLAEKQLSELDNLIIVNQGQRYASVYRAGTLTEAQTTAIATKLALAGVKKALFYAADYALLEDWTSQLPRLKSDAESGNSLVVKAPYEEINLLQMADNEKALLLAARYEGLAIHPDSEAFYRYVSGVWEKISPLELSREMGNIYRQYNTNFSKRTVNNVVEALKIIVPVLGEPCKEVIPFANVNDH